MFGRISTSLRAILVTGANRGLGLSLAKRLSASENYQVYLTARNPEETKKYYKEHAIKYSNIFGLDLFSSPSSKISQILDTVPGLSAVIHCASPYTTKPLLETSEEEMKQYAHCMYLDQIIMKKSLEKLQKSKHRSPTLIMTGAVIGLPEFYSRGIMGLLKAQQRQLMGILHEEAIQDSSKICVRHLTLGSFRDEPEDITKFIPTSFVADVIIRMLNNPEGFSFDTCLLPKENEDYYNVQATLKPEDLHCSYKI